MRIWPLEVTKAAGRRVGGLLYAIRSAFHAVEVAIVV
jgi:hypothetical protein